MLNYLSGYRTVLVAVLIAVFGVLEQTDWTQFVSEENKGWLLLIIAVIMAALRAITKTPLGGRQ